MSRSRFLVAFFLLTLAWTSSTAAQSLEKRHQIELRIGGWSKATDTRTSVGAGDLTTTVASTGFVGGLAYGHWLREELALRISASLLAASSDAELSGTTVATNVAAVVPVLVGVRYYFPKTTYGGQFRPFAGAGVGSFVGSQASTQIGTSVVNESRTETVLGGEIETGVGIVLDRYVLATVAAAYDLMTDLSEPVGGSRNYSGPQITIGISLLLGGKTGRA